MDKIKNWRNIAFGLLAMVVMACTDETAQSGITLGQGEVALQWLGPNMGIQRVSTRGTDAKTAEEQAIYNVHVFIFDADGNYLEANTAGDVSDAFQGYRYVADGQNLVLQSSMFDKEQAAKTATIVAVANVPSDTFGDVTGNGHPVNVKNIEDLAKFVFSLSKFTADIPETGLPMIGVAQADLSPTATEKVHTVQMESLMARIDLDFTMNPYQSSDDGQNPALRIDKVYVGNFPTGCTIDPQLDPTINTDNKEAEVTTGISLLSQETEVAATDFTGHILREDSPQSLTLYMFEHARAAKALEEVFKASEYEVGDDGYPENIADDEKQRYKNSLAHEEAAYISLEGVYTNHNGYKYAVTYTLYPGADATDDFTIKHNRQYIHNITVTGITVNNMGTEALLDTRVDIDSDENPYFIEMLREREHDAHFCVTPMDIFIYKGGTVKVEIEDPENHTWIRMEPIKEAATQAGYGKRDYFVTNLVTDDLKDNIEYIVTSADATKPHEERIYFYIDENVPTMNQWENNEEVKSREATLLITYTELKNPNPGENPRTHTREIVIRQAGMLPVQFTSNDNISYTFYFEKYEEYLNHYDGKDQYDHSYPGLEWGFMDIETGLGGTDGNTYMKYGWRNTMQIMQKFRNNNGTYTDEKDDITLNEKPRGATEYCYNKNKRNSYGQVEECHWFHPTISEQEQMMDQYYGTDSVFQQNWYWSSNPGPWGRNGGNDDASHITWTGESYEHARATKSTWQIVTENNQSAWGFSHARSEADRPYAKLNGSWDTPYTGDMAVTEEGEGGFARRNKVFRIRAAYIPDKPNNYDAPSLSNNDYLH